MKKLNSEWQWVSLKRLKISLICTLNTNNKNNVSEPNLCPATMFVFLGPEFQSSYPQWWITTMPFTLICSCSIRDLIGNQTVRLTMTSLRNQNIDWKVKCRMEKKNLRWADLWTSLPLKWSSFKVSSPVILFSVSWWGPHLRSEKFELLITFLFKRTMRWRFVMSLLEVQCLNTHQNPPVLLHLKNCGFWSPAMWFTEKLNTYNLIVMELCHWLISVRKRGFLGTTRLQIIYKLQFFSNCGLPNISVSLCRLILSGTGIQAQYHRPRIVPLISCNCTSLEKTWQLTTKHNLVLLEWKRFINCSSCSLSAELF